MNTSEVLDLAADEIERRGWYSVGSKHCPDWQPDCWGSMDGTDAVCLEGAIAAVSRIENPGFKGGAELRACPAFIAMKDYLGVRPMEWNDDVHRKPEEVIETLRAAAAVERAREAAEERTGVSA